MTITTQPSRNEYTASAGQTIFNYTFKIYTNSDLNVYITPAGQDANDATDITTAYTVSGLGDPNGGTITLNSGATLNDRVTIVSSIPTDRTTDYQVNGDFIPDTVNNDVDRTVSLVKQVESLASRTVQFQESQQNAEALTLPAPSPGKLIEWNSGGTGFDNSTIDTDQVKADSDSAAASAALAEQWAENPFEDPVVPGQFSALHWATTASNTAATIPTSGVGFLPFVASTGAADNVDLLEPTLGNFELPFFDSSGLEDNVAIIGI